MKMSELKVFTIKKNIHEDNKKVANETRTALNAQDAFFVNIMSSPGSGKTTTLVSTIKALKSEMKIGVIEADVDSDVDARTVQEAGAKAVQMHTGGLCHLDATMARAGLDELGFDDLDLVFLENIGNLICPGSFADIHFQFQVNEIFISNQIFLRCDSMIGVTTNFLQKDIATVYLHILSF